MCCVLRSTQSHDSDVLFASMLQSYLKHIKHVSLAWCSLKYPCTFRHGDLQLKQRFVVRSIVGVVTTNKSFVLVVMCLICV